MKTIELTEHELDQASGGSVEPTSSATSPTGGFRWRLRIINPTEG